MQSSEMNSVRSVIKLEPGDFLPADSLPSSAEATDDFTAADDDQTSFSLVTSLLTLIFMFLTYFILIPTVPCIFSYLYDSCVDLNKGTQTHWHAHIHAHTSLMDIFSHGSWRD